MNTFKNFALKRPFVFGLGLIVIYALLGTLTYPAHFLFADTEVGQVYGDAVSKLIIALVFLFLLWRLGWFKASGITRLGNVTTWSVVAIILLYKFPTELYAFTGDISIPFPKSQLAIAKLLYYFPASSIEEIMFRAFALTAMLLAWGDTKQGQVKAVLLSSAFFGVTHLFNIIVRPSGVVLFQAIVVMLPGILYGALVLTHKTLWPAIVLHWLTNAVVNIKIIEYANYQETIAMWVTFAIALLPLMGYSAYLIQKLPEPYKLDGGDI